MKLDQLYYLSEAIRCHSISKAAEENYVPASTVSASISRLEVELETTLLTRSNKGIIPTDSGLRVAEKCQQIFSLISEIRAETNEKRSQIILNISAMPSLVDTLLSDTVLNIEQEGLPLFLNIVTDEPSMILQNVQLGISHMGLLFDMSPHMNANLTRFPLFRDRYCLLIGKRSPWFNKSSITIEEALSIPHIAYRSEFQKETNFLTRLTAAHGKPQVACRVDNTESMRRIIAKSEYCAFFPHHTVYHDAYVEGGYIRPLEISDADLSFDISVIESSNYKDMQGNSLLMEVLKKTVSSL